MKKLVLFLSVLFVSWVNSNRGVNPDLSGINNNGTVYSNQYNSYMNGESSFTSHYLIDSLLVNEEVPFERLSFHQMYSSYMDERDMYITLTAYYEDSPFPADHFYHEWNQDRVHPYKTELAKENRYVELIIEDRLNFCLFSSPINNPNVTSGFGFRDGKMHKGVDLDLETWDAVGAAFEGMVRVAKYDPEYGRVIIIRHYNGLETLYAHLHQLKVKAGDVVEAGQLIGYGGTTGRSSGSHLHFEIRFMGQPINPEQIIAFKNNSLISDSLILRKNYYGYVAIPEGQEFYKIKRGDHLSRIAYRYGTTVGYLCKINGISKRTVLKVGQRLKVS